MESIDEMTDVQKAWLLCKKLKDLQNLLWEIYHIEFRKLEERDILLSIDPESLPF